MQQFITVCEEAARQAGALLLDWQGKFQVREKAPADLVTEADVASQQRIQELLLDAFPDHGFLGEEDTANAQEHSPAGTEGQPRPEYCWIVDPLDGTTNYVHGLPNYCVSIALRRSSEVVMGTIYDPVTEECYTASAGQGARLNGQPLYVSGVSTLAEALVAASLPPRVARDSRDVKLLLETMYHCQAIRRMGSAALNLCYVAAGRLDGYWATSVRSWDIAAGLLMVREAGGVMTGIDGSPFNLERPHLVAAANQQLHDQLVSVLSRVG